MNKKSHLTLLILLMFFMVFTGLAKDLKLQADGTKGWNFSDAFKEMDKDGTLKTICENVKNVDFPVVDKPNKIDIEKLKSCQSDRYYYGIGIPLDYVKARKCAFIEIEKNEHHDFGGSAILMMIYANGYGVKRNIDLAIHLACMTDGAPAEIIGRINHLYMMKTQATKNIFDFCDDITSGYMQGMCQSEANDIAQAKRAAELKKMTANWTKQQKNAFEYLYQEANNYFSIRAMNETDLSGTAAAAEEIAIQDEMQEGFNQALKHFEKGRFPSFSIVDFNKSEKQLDKIYQQIMILTKSPDRFGTITRDNIQKVQRAWLHYCSVWIKFAAIRYPQISTVSWKTWLIQERIKQLEAIRFQT